MQDLLIHMRAFEPWSRAAEYGVQLAALLDAAVTGAYVQPTPLHAAPTYSSPELLAAIFDSARETEALALKAAEPFKLWAKEQGVSHAEWRVTEGDTAQALAHIGTWHDLLILDRGIDDDRASPAALARLILATGLPCLVVPQSGDIAVTLDCVAVGWNGSQESIRAIHAALPMLQHASRVVLLRGHPRVAWQDVTWRPPLDIETYLQRHGIHAEHKPLDGEDGHAGEALLAAAERVSADLLVMGAYGRSRFSEWTLGGATRHVLEHGTVPLFLRH